MRRLIGRRKKNQRKVDMLVRKTDEVNLMQTVNIKRSAHELKTNFPSP